MYSRAEVPLLKSLSFRLTLFFFLGIVSVLLVVFFITYLSVDRLLIANARSELTEDLQEGFEIYTREGLKGLKRLADTDTREDGPARLLERVVDPHGGVVFSTDTTKWGKLPPPAVIPPYGKIQLDEITIPARPQEDAVMGTLGLDGKAFQIVEALSWQEGFLEQVQKAFWTGALPALGLSMLAAWLMALKASKRISEIDRISKHIAQSGELSKRVPVSKAGDEIDSLGATFNIMLDRIQEFVHQLNETFDNTAHDLKTPLARIRSMAERHANLHQEECSEVMVQILNETDRFLWLLNAIMDISEARTGVMRLSEGPVSVSTLLEEMKQVFNPVAEAGGITLEVIVPEGDLSVTCDRKRITQALANLADNALKFTPPGGTVVIWSEEDQDKVLLCVRDTGPGIAPGYHERIFERFFRLDPSGSGKGRGIGLSLAKAFVEAHGGEIRVESTQGRGSTFCISLKRAMNPERPQ